MALKDQIFSMHDFQKKAACGVHANRDFGLDMEFKGTLEESLDYVRSKGTMDYWVCLWTVMQFFEPIEARRVALHILDKVVPERQLEEVAQGMHALNLYVTKQIDDAVLKSVHERLSMKYMLERGDMSKEEKLLVKSVLAAIGDEPNKSCPLVGLNFRDQVGHAFVDETVRAVLREHP